jgi:hypothetical protein
MASSVPPHERRIEYWTKVMVLIGTIVGSGYAAWLKLGDVTTSVELQAHDMNEAAHASLRGILRAQAEQDQDLRMRIDEQTRISQELGERLVSLIAADRETSTRYKAAAASFYRNEYRLLIRRNYKVDDAIAEALRVPWSDRPRW